MSNLEHHNFRGLPGDFGKFRGLAGESQKFRGLQGNFRAAAEVPGEIPVQCFCYPKMVFQPNPENFVKTRNFAIAGLCDLVAIKSCHSGCGRMAGNSRKPSEASFGCKLHSNEQCGEMSFLQALESCHSASGCMVGSSRKSPKDQLRRQVAQHSVMWGDVRLSSPRVSSMWPMMWVTLFIHWRMFWLML